MRPLKGAAALLAIALIASSCGSGTPTTPVGSQPSSGQPTSGQPTSGQPTGPQATPAPSASGPTGTRPPLEPLPDPELSTPTAIVQAMSEPGMAEQVVVSMLDQLGIGLYKPEGTPIRAGTETSESDFFVFEPEARGLVNMLKDKAKPDAQITFRDFHAALTGLGFTGSAEDLAQAYADAYASQPDAAISQYATALAPVDVEGTMPRFTAWLLVLDGFIPPNGSGQAMAVVGRTVPAVAVGGGGGWGVAQSQVQQISSSPASAMATLVERLTALVAGTIVMIDMPTTSAHEGHGSAGTPLQTEGCVFINGHSEVDPFTGVTHVEGIFGQGIPVTWVPEANVDLHGTVTETSVTRADGCATFIFTPKEEAANGQGVLKTDTSSVEIDVSGSDLITRMYGNANLGALIPDTLRDSASFNIEWHEETDAQVTIIWTDVYDNVPDVFTFEGKLDTLDPLACSPDVQCLTGSGTVEGTRAAWAACNPGIEDVPSGTVDATFNGVIVGDKITISAYADTGTALSGVTTGPFEVSLDGGLLTILPSTPVGNPCPHYSYGSISAQQILAP